MLENKEISQDNKELEAELTVLMKKISRSLEIIFDQNMHFTVFVHGRELGEKAIAIGNSPRKEVMDVLMSFITDNRSSYVH